MDRQSLELLNHGTARKMSSQQGEKDASGSTMVATENVKPNRYEAYSNTDETYKLENADLKTAASSQTNTFGNLLYRGKQGKGVTLHIKDETVLGKDCGGINSVLTTRRPKSALSDPYSSCSLFGVSLNQPLKYSRNALTVKDAMDKRRRSSCSELTPGRQISRRASKD